MIALPWRDIPRIFRLAGGPPRPLYWGPLRKMGKADDLANFSGRGLVFALAIAKAIWSSADRKLKMHSPTSRLISGGGFRTLRALTTRMPFFRCGLVTDS